MTINKNYTCPWCKQGQMKPNFEKDKLISICCDACGFIVAPVEKEKINDHRNK